MRKGNGFRIAALLLTAGMLAGCVMAAPAPAAEPAAPVQEVSEEAEPAAEVPDSAGYAETLFDTSRVHTVELTIAPEDWALLLEHPLDKEKFKADVTIDGETIPEVSVSTKGNYTLLYVAGAMESDRYSLRLNFGKYVDGQTYRGLDKLSLNNMFSDMTYMKNHMCYWLFRQMGVDAPLTSYVWLTVNGEDHGLYMAAEDMDKGHLRRVYDGDGVIYKPEPGGLDMTPEDLAWVLEVAEKGELEMPDKPSQGANLAYIDDNIDSYPEIMNNAETKAKDGDKAEMVAALKALSEGRPEDAFDTDEVIRYFAAHNFVLNYDNYTGPMLHNMVIVERDGKLTLGPWDYDSAFGAFRFVIDASAYENPTDLLNMGIDTPLIRTTEEERPAWAFIVSGDGGYLEAYHAAMDELVSKYMESGAFDQEADAVASLIAPYVEKDPTAFYTAEEFEQAVAVMKEFNRRRAMSVRKQLDGTLAADNGQQADEDKVDASDLRIDDMGSMIK